MRLVSLSILALFFSGCTSIGAISASPDNKGVWVGKNTNILGFVTHTLYYCERSNEGALKCAHTEEKPPLRVEVMSF